MAEQQQQGQQQSPGQAQNPATTQQQQQAASVAAVAPGHQLLVSTSDGGQPLVLSAEDAAQLLAQAGLQLAPADGEPGDQVVLGAAPVPTSSAAPGAQQQQPQTGVAGAGGVVDGEAPAATAAGDLPAGIAQAEPTAVLAATAQDPNAAAAGAGVALGEIDDGTILYIDPNDPQAAELLQQAGLQLAEDGTVSSVVPGAATVATSASSIDTAGMDLMAQAAHASQLSEAAADVGAPTDASKTAVTLAGVSQGQHILEQALASTLGKDEAIEHLPPSSVEAISTTAASSTGPQAVPSSTSGPVMATSSAGSIIKTAAPVITPSLPATPVSSQPAQGQQQSGAASLTSAGRGAAAANAPQATSPAGSFPKEIQVGPDQQKVDYTVTSEDGRSQQYVMLCPKNMDQNLLIQTLVKQISSDPSTRSGKKTIRITQQKEGGLPGAIAPPPPAAAAANKLATGQSPGAKVIGGSPSPQRARATAASSPKKGLGRQSGGALSQQQQQQQTPKAVRNDLFASQTMASGVTKTVLDSNEIFESVVPELPIEPADGSTRVYVRCAYCPTFRSSLNGDTWETILNHILPVAKEEMYTSFYGDLSKHFIRSLRIQINGKQVVRDPMTGKQVPQCEVILTHSLVCKKTKREFIITNPDAAFVANLAKHIHMTQPGASQRGNSLLCIFCNSPFTYEDYLRHVQPHLDSILATLNCFAGAYCVNFYETSIRATRNCSSCGEAEPADLRFLPCTAFSADYSCAKRLQFAVDCFREHYGDHGFLRFNNSTVCRCSVCKNPQPVYCAVFHISTTFIGEDNVERPECDTQLAVCVNCQKQFVNIVTKERGFDENLKLFQLKNMEQLCSVLRVILNQATVLTEQKKSLIYTVQENPNNMKSAIHVVKSAELTQVSPMTRMLALAESEVVGSPVKAQFLCDLCYFSVDLTSLIASEKEKQKNDMLLAIVLEHLVPHTDSLINVIASTTANQMLALKYDIHARVTDVPQARQTKITLSLRKKLKASHSKTEIAIDKDEEKTMGDIRMAAKADRKVNVKSVKGQQQQSGQASSDSTANNTAVQLMEVNRFIDKHRGKFGVLYQTGCNTTLLNAYTECRLCSKFSFPDFRLTGAAALSNGGTKSIDLCENCVETVLSLCLPTEPECLTDAEECLALGEQRLVGHRLVLSNNLKKWLSLDGVNLIKKTIDDFERVRHVDSSNLFQSTLKKHIAAVLKTLQKDEDITQATTGFCINDTFLQLDKKKDDALAATMASLEQQVGIPIVQAKEPTRTEVQVTILSRRPPGVKSAAAASHLGAARNGVIMLKGGYASATRKANGTVINLGGNAQIKKSAAASDSSTPKAIVRVGAVKKLQTSTRTKASAPTSNKTTPITSSGESSQEESISAIKNFLEETESSANKDGGGSVEVSPDLKVPPGIKLTSVGKGVVNLRAVADTPSRQGQGTLEVLQGQSCASSSPSAQDSTADSTPTGSKGSSSGARGMKGVSMVTLTANGIVKKADSKGNEKMKGSADEEGDSDLTHNEVAAATSSGAKKRKATAQTEDKGKKARMSYSTPKRSEPPPVEETTRSGRQRKQKKIFDL